MKYKNREKIISNKVNYTPEDARNIVNAIFYEDSDPQKIFQKLAEKVIPKLMDGNNEEKEWAKNQILGRSSEAIMTSGLVNHYQLTHTVNRQYSSLIIEVAREIERNYNCTTVLEKTLAEIIAIAYMKVIDSSRMFIEQFESKKNINMEQTTGYLEVLSRHNDRANRQFLNALAILKQIKQPPIELNIKTKNIFTVHNQQISNNSTQQ
ncbi:MAG TPA: hypothetical protein VJI66_02620 [Candidatus Paceibacterota bacterium]